MNELWICFEEPVSVSVIRVLNYSKSPSRGVREFEVLVDDALLFVGVLRKHTIIACSLANHPQITR